MSSISDFFKAVTNLETAVDLVSYLQDILTPQELEELALRWQIVRLLDAGMPQREIATTLKCSVTTVSRGSRQLKYGFGGFEKALLKVRTKTKMKA
jgi:Trp operon repressor